MLRLASVAALLVALGPPAVTRADGFAPRTVDFQSGFVLGQPLHEGFDPLPGVGLELRGFSANHLWVSAETAFEATLDLRDPEHGELVPLLAAGVGAGVWADLGSRVTLFAGARLEWIHAWNAPQVPCAACDERLVAPLREDVDGLRAGPVASAAFLLGHFYGHPMAIEGRVTWYGVWLDGADRSESWQAGLFLTGVLFPDRPLR